MRIATWNVNSVRARLPVLLDWLARAKPDVVCLQETKCLEEAFPREAIEDAGYQCAIYGQKTYNGVAILSKRRIEDVARGMQDGVEDPEARVISAVVEDVILVDVYVVNGQEVGHPRYEYKLEWLERLAKDVARRFDVTKEKVVVCGDFNVTFDDRDVHDPGLWHEKILCSTREREALAKLTDLGLADSFRKFHEEGGHFTWWDFRTKGFQRKQGLRIDHLLLSPPAMAACSAVEIDLEPRAGEKPSDHAPVIATLG
ncbi:MAG: exodeoxyribonuclease III [Planctomycetota bacterium]